jgi:hypothetical protein
VTDLVGAVLRSANGLLHLQCVKQVLTDVHPLEDLKGHEGHFSYCPNGRHSEAQSGGLIPHFSSLMNYCYT